MHKALEPFRVIKDFLGVLPFVATYKPPSDDEALSMGLVFQNTAAKFSQKPAIMFEGRELSWQQFNNTANQFAHLLKKQGVKRGEVISLVMENRIEMLAATIGSIKIGATVALINTNLRGKSLIHCISITESVKCLVGEELQESISEVKSELPLADQDYLWFRDTAINSEQSEKPVWGYDFMAHVNAMPNGNLPETSDIRAGEKALFIFTSGTTGLPKAAIIFHRRLLASSTVGHKALSRAKQKDRIYICLPLYHMTGLTLGFGSSVLSGASVVLKRKFSASQFWSDIQRYQANSFVYIGELCRYLAMQPKRPEEKNSPLKTMFGNGLRPDVWEQFRSRFKVQRISEVYGSSEGNVSFYNLLNKDRTIGTTTAELMLVKYDIDNDEMITNANGKLEEVEVGEPGLLLAKIEGRYLYDGYQDKEATNSKILSDLKTPGDRWFNTGDLVRRIDVGFALGLPHFQFVDRVGDTFRWRAENVSTNEVGEILNSFEQVDMANVYGVEVPGAEGKAGMAALTLNKGSDFDASAFSLFVEQQLPAHARPVFIRIQEQAETTGTFKLLKGQLRKEAYHLGQHSEPIYMMKPRQSNYELLADNDYQQIVKGNAGF